MKENIFKPGDTKVYRKHVTEEDFARFGDALVHPVCSTFALAQAAEWAGRLFLLELIDEDEEGIGQFLHIDHKSPAFEGEELVVVSTLKQHEDNTVICRFEAHVVERLVAEGETGQKIFKKEELLQILDQANY
ncbi:thioesterase family protein [Botryobacter ruber]|uniref:thioesterase family protein n=1 Tax=Botryobacter ruber TaxID=2171629 RepID=UPI000E0B6CCB|nr:hypothetical protein [Botryobacter ruber]